MHLFDFEAIRENYTLSDTVGNHVKLKRSGSEWKGLCPFHEEKTPSFYVNDAKGKFHCQGCGASGDIVDFVRHIQGCSVVEAIEAITGNKPVSADPALAEKRQEQAEAREAEEARQHAEAAAIARARWEKAKPAPADNPYLQLKGIEPGDCRCEGENLLVPAYNADEELVTVQSIRPDKQKRFQLGSTTRGIRLRLGIHFGRTIVCEGYATGASIYDAMPDQVCIAFSKANVMILARELAEQGTPFLIAGEVKGREEYIDLGKQLDCPVVFPDQGDDFNDQAQAMGVESISTTINRGLKNFAKAKEDAKRAKEKETQPADLWETQEPPAIPEGILPPIIENFAAVTAKSKGIDPGGIVMSCLTACASVITDKIEIKVKRNEDWRESARIWTMLIGDPSYKKSPMIKSGARKIAKMDAELIAKYNSDFNHWKEMGEQGVPPQPKRLRINDTTIEAAQEVCAQSPDGIICVQDELSGWFGGIEKYSGGKGSAKDRSFWLQAFGGGSYAVDRIGRKSTLVENLSISILGGVQPDPIRKIVHEATDDGLIQRFFPIVLQPSKPDEDDECEDVDTGYDALIDALYALKPIDSVLGYRPLQFDDGAQAIRKALAIKHHKSVSAIERVNKKLAAHIGKFDGLFPRLCIIWHCIEHVTSRPGEELEEYISEETARRVSIFLSKFLMRHSMAFYSGILGLADDHSALQDVAGYILAHKAEFVTQRTLQRGSRGMRKLTREEGSRIFEQLEAFGWLEQANKRSDAPRWDVNPKVHEIYEAQANEERERREDARLAILELVSSSRDDW